MKVNLGTQPCDAGRLPAFGERGGDGGRKCSFKEGGIIFTLISAWGL